MSEPLYQAFPMAPGHRAQVWQHRPSFRRPRHFHQEPELNLVTRGVARMGVGEREVQLEAGDLLFLRPGEDHELLKASPDLQLFVLAVTPELSTRCWTGRVPAGVSSFRLDDAQLRALTPRLLATEKLSDRAEHELVVAELFRSTRESLPLGHVVARRALNRMYDAPQISAEHLASHLQVEPSELSRLFHREFGLRFVDARARVRLMRFVELVDEGQDLTRAAQEAGFGSYAQCHRVFRRHVSVAPRVFFAGAREQVFGAYALLDDFALSI